MSQTHAYRSDAESASESTSIDRILNRADRDIRAAAAKTRNNVLFGKARWVFEFVHGGGITKELAEHRLTDAAGAVGLSSHEIQRTLQSAYRKAKANPKTLEGRKAESGAPAPPPRPPEYPPLGAVEGVLRSTKTPLSDEEACAWLKDKRGLDPELCHRLGRVRVIDIAQKVSTETMTIVPKRSVDGKRYPVPGIGYRLLFPLVNPLGKTRSALLRRCFETDDNNLPKSMGLFGARKRLVIANRPALALLRRDKARARWWGDQPLDVVITEGEMDFLQACIEPHERMRAVLGIFAGSWCESIAEAIPSGARLIIAVDDDDEHDKFTNEVLRTAKGRPCFRWKPTISGHDLNDAGGLRGGKLYAAQ